MFVCRVQIKISVIVATMAPIFFAFSFFAKNEEFAAIFREKRKKILPIKIIKIAFAMTIFSILTNKNFYTRLIFIFLPNFYHFLKWNMLETLWNFEKSSKMTKILQKMSKKWRKFIFRFSSPIFRRKTKNWKKTKNENSSFRWDP